MSLRQKVSFLFKFIIVFTSLGGTVYGFFTATLDGYSVWYKRLLYFTTQSNVWIGVVYLAIILIYLFKKSNNEKLLRSFYLCKYFFVVSISITGLVFCSVLGPFADESFRAWSLYSLLAHVITPVLSITEFYIDEYEYNFKNSHVLGTIIAPLIYFALTMILGAVKYDFGRGDPFPYFFLDIHSDVGLFGFKSKPLPNMGTVWWILLLLSLIIGIGFLFMKTHHLPTKRKRKKQLSN